MNIEAAELAEVTTSGGLTIGSLGLSGSITVTNIASADSDEITGMLTLVATEDASTITFATTASTFDTLAAQADAAVSVQTMERLLILRCIIKINCKFSQGARIRKCMYCLVFKHGLFWDSLNNVMDIICTMQCITHMNSLGKVYKLCGIRHDCRHIIMTSYIIDVNFSPK